MSRFSMVQPGDTIGSYIIEALLAEGGMGAVYRAKNRVTGQPRAIKIIKADLARKPDFVDRFVREATIASQVRHPFLVETLEPGIDGETIYLPMELLTGETLFHRLRRVKRMSPEEAAAILGPVCDAVQALHDRRLVHRDLKPMNVFLARTADGREIPKVLDFGTAREETDDEHTKTGMVVGSPFYMAPEQAEGRRDVDARADQYAVGVMAYQLVTGHRPYESDDTRSALAKLLRGDPYVPPRRIVALPDAFESVIVRSLMRERDARFARIAEFGAALRATATGPTSPMTSPELAAPSPSIPPAMPFGALLHGAPTAIHGVTGGVPSASVTSSSEAPMVAAHFTPPPSGVHPGPGMLGGQRSGRRGVAIGLGALAVLVVAIGLGASQLAGSPPPVTATELSPRTATGRSGTGSAVGTGSIGTGSIGTGSIGTGSIGTGSIGTGSIGTGSIGTGSVGTGSVGTGSVGTGSVGTGPTGTGPLVVPSGGSTPSSVPGTPTVTGAGASVGASDDGLPSGGIAAGGDPIGPSVPTGAEASGPDEAGPRGTEGRRRDPRRVDRAPDGDGDTAGRRDPSGGRRTGSRGDEGEDCGAATGIPCMD